MTTTPDLREFYPCDLEEVIPCRYSALHYVEGVPAVTEVPSPILGDVPACQRCADFYARMS